MAIAAPAQPPIPAAFANPEELAGLPQDQQDMRQEIMTNFSQEVQSSGASPSTPAYSDGWKKAVWRANDAFEAQVGIDQFNASEETK